MKKLTLLLILLIGSLSYGQTIIYSNAPDRQKIAFDTITGDISLQNSPSINIGPYVKANATIPIIFEDASNKTIGPDDNSKFFLNRTNNDYTYTVQNQANGGYDNSTLAYTFGVDSTLAGYTGKIFVKGETGSNVIPKEISTTGKAAALIRRGANDWLWNGSGAVPWDPYGPELMGDFAHVYGSDSSTLPSDGGNNQQMRTNTGASVVAVLDSSSGLGDYVIEVESTADTADRRIRLYLELEVGKTYEVRAKIKNIVGDLGSLRIHDGGSNGNAILFTTMDWEEKVVQFTADGTGLVQLQPGFASSGSMGYKIRVKLSVRLIK